MSDQQLYVDLNGRNVMIDRWIADLFAAPGVREWWQANRYKDHRFAEVVNEILASTEGSDFRIELFGVGP